VATFNVQRSEGRGNAEFLSAVHGRRRSLDARNSAGLRQGRLYESHTRLAVQFRWWVVRLDEFPHIDKAHIEGILSTCGLHALQRIHEQRRCEPVPGQGAGARFVEGLLAFCRGEIDRTFVRAGCLMREHPRSFGDSNAL
jgi:hypothetical protein